MCYPDSRKYQKIVGQIMSDTSLAARLIETLLIAAGMDALV
jgi:hypothetical protein